MQSAINYVVVRKKEGYWLIRIDQKGEACKCFGVDLESLAKTFYLSCKRPEDKSYNDLLDDIKNKAAKIY